MDITAILPPALLAAGPRGLAYWQWLALPLVLGVAWIAGKLLGGLSQAVLGVVVRRTSATWDDRLIEVVGAPLVWLWTIFVAYLMVGALWLPEAALSVVHTTLRLWTLLVFFWILLRLVNMVGRSAQASAWATSRPSMRALVPLGVSVGRVAVAALALVALLADLGYPVASLVAGLGIGGLAVALGAQKTLENLFGAFAISVDQPFSVGDDIVADGISGKVESIGLRSTRVRTIDRTMVSIPNGKLADLRVESMTGRDRIRLGWVLLLAHGLESDQVRGVVHGIDQLLRGNAKIFQGDFVVCLKGVTSEALEIEINLWFLTTDFGEYRTLRQDLLLLVMAVVEKAGGRLAVPTRAVQLQDERRISDGVKSA